MQNEQLSALVTTGDGVVIWDFISQQIDLRSGVVQDKLQVKYDSLKVTVRQTLWHMYRRKWI